MYFTNNGSTIYINTIYNVSEQKTGVWIDEKPIYRRIFTDLDFGKSKDNWHNTGVTLSNVSQVISGKAIRTSDKAEFTSFDFRVSGENVQYYSMRALDTGCDILILEYTKTTD